MDASPRVTVLVMTYNHAEYIRQALDSVLMQRTNFAVEIVVSEDCSTDGTRAIVQEVAQRHPEQFRLILSPANVANNTVVTRGLDAARGEYIALLDGDDYWTDPDKLQRQVDFMDRHPECALCFHNAQVIDESGLRAPWLWTPPGHPTFSALEQIWMGNFIATCSALFRRLPRGSVPAWYTDLFPITDWPLHLLNAARGSIGYIDAVMGVYRYHSRGYYSPLSEAQKLAKNLQLYRTLDRNFGYQYHHLAQVAVAKYFVEWAEEYWDRGDRARAWACLRTALTGRLPNRYVSLRRLLVLGARLALPPAITAPGAALPKLGAWARSRR